MINWCSVNSTAIRKIGYDSESRQMYIDFEDSDPYYTYCGVPEHVYQGFVNSSSVGSYYHQYIKDKYDC